MITAAFNDNPKQPSNGDDSAAPPDEDAKSALDHIINDKKYGRPPIVCLYLLRALSSDAENPLPSQENPGQNPAPINIAEKWGDVARAITLTAHYKYDNRGRRTHLLRNGIISTEENGQDTLTRLGQACLAVLEIDFLINNAQIQAARKKPCVPSTNARIAETHSSPEMPS